MEVGGLLATEVGVGDVVLIPPGCPQRITNTGSADLVFLAICTPRFMPQAYEDIEDEIVGQQLVHAEAASGTGSIQP